MAILEDFKPIAIIPARGGSKRIPHKNIKDFLGKPLIAYSILTALKSKLFSQVIVSTDCPKIASISEQYGAKVPHLREAHLSDDFTATLDVIADAIIKNKIPLSSPVCCIYPTAPLLQTKHLIRAHQILQAKSPSYVFLASEFSFTPFRGFSFEQGALQMLFPNHQNTRSQDLPPLYHDAGQFYFGVAQSFCEKLPIFSPSSFPLIVSNLEVQDIDTIQDFELAKLKYQLLKNTKNED